MRREAAPRIAGRLAAFAQRRAGAGAVAGLAADAELRPGRLVSVLRGVEALRKLVTWQSTHMKFAVCLDAGPMQGIAGVDTSGRERGRTSAAAGRLGRASQAMPKACRRPPGYLHQVLLQRRQSEVYFTSNSAGLPSGPSVRTRKLVVGQEGRRHALLVEGRVIEGPQHRAGPGHAASPRRAGGFPGGGRSMAGRAGGAADEGAAAWGLGRRPAGWRAGSGRAGATRRPCPERQGLEE